MIQITEPQHPEQWDDVAKAQWILENGKPHIVWIFERANGMVYKRPMADPGSKLPPWINRVRTPVQPSQPNTEQEDT